MNEALTKVALEAADLIHADKRVDAAARVARFSGLKAGIKDAEEATEILLAFFYGLLDADEYELAARLLWPETLFSPEPEFCRRIWKALRTSAMVLMQGAASTSKTYAAGVFYFLDWVRDPQFTTVRVLGPSEDHLQSNLFSHLVGLHKQASLPMPGNIGDLFMGMDRRDRRGSIQGVVVPLGKKGAGRLQGTKRFPRKQDHPRFGRLSRIRVLLDEAEKIPSGIWQDIDNIVANLDGADGLKIAGAYNPQDITSDVATRAEPDKGWENFDVDADYDWTSRRGWTVVRLDGERCENVLQSKVVYHGLQTREGLDMLARTSGGTQSPGYYTFGRGAYPPMGTVLSIISPAMLKTFRGEFIFVERPRRLGAADLSLEGDDEAFLAAGLFGYAAGVKYPSSLEHPEGREVMFKDAQGRNRIKVALQIEQLISLEKGDTPSMARQLKRLGLQLGIEPDWFLVDRTGNGAGVHDLLREIWNPAVRGVNYSSSSTELKIFQEDTQVPHDLYNRLYTELLFAFRRWLEFGNVALSPGVDTSKLFTQLTGRRYLTGSRVSAESKPEYKRRTGLQSPNESDAVTLILHCARLASGIVPVMTLDSADLYLSDEDMEVVVGCTDRVDHLE